MALALPREQILVRNNVRVCGRPEGRPLVFVHGFATDQRMWRFIAAELESEYRVVLLDQVGAGHSDVTAYDVLRHRNARGYAEDLVEVADALDLRDAVIVAHSFGAMVGILAQVAAPDRFGALALVGPSARYVDDAASDYIGGLTPEAVEELLEALESNFHGWSNAMAPAIMGNPDRPELADELAEAFTSTDPDIAARWARVTFHSDIRAALPGVTAPAVVLQCTDDPIVPFVAGRWLADNLPNAAFVQLAATGHCPHLSAPQETLAAITAFLEQDAR